MHLRDYQETGVRHLLSGQRKLLLDDQGLGKTAQAVVAFNRLGAKRVLIICPPATRYGWEAEVKRWDSRGHRVHVLTKEIEWVPEDASVIVCSYSLLGSPMITDQLKGIRWGCTIIDEIHFCKSTKANRTQVVLGGRSKGIIHNSVYVWGLTGTLMTNSPIDLWPVFRSLGREHLPEMAQDYMGYTKVFCKRYKTRWGHWDVSGSANIPVLNKSLLGSGFALRRLKADVLKELPDKQFRIVPLDVKDDKATIAWDYKLRHSDLKKSNLGLGADELAEARKVLAEQKMNAVLEYVRDTDGPIVVFGWHREFLEAMSYSIKDSVLYYGGMTPKKKEKAKSDFINGKARVFVANIASAGTGLDGLQHRSAHAVFAEIPWTYAEVAQAADRLHRMGQNEKVLIDLMVARGGIESYILNRVVFKEKNFGELLDTPLELSKLL